MTTGGQGRAGCGSPTPSADSPCSSIRLFLHSLSWEQPKIFRSKQELELKYVLKKETSPHLGTCNIMIRSFSSRPGRSTGYIQDISPSLSIHDGVKTLHRKFEGSACNSYGDGINSLLFPHARIHIIL